MRAFLLLVAFTLVMLTTGCYLPISGKVIDAETNKPIEGAVILVEWTISRGYRLTYTESYKVAEKLSDKDGKVDLPGCYSPFVHKPHVTIYKKGYVVWNNKYIFPDQIQRIDFTWKNGNLFRMYKFKQEYSFIKHQTFIDSAALPYSDSKKKEKFIKAYEEWEEGEVIKERNKKKQEIK